MPSWPPARRALTTRPKDGETLDSERLKAKLGDMVMKTELLEAKIAVLEEGPPFGPTEVAAMRAATSPGSGRPYGLALVCRVWRVARATVYRRRAPAVPGPRRRPGPVGPMPDVELLERIRGVLAASPFHGRGPPQGLGPPCASPGCARRVTACCG